MSETLLTASRWKALGIVLALGFGAGALVLALTPYGPGLSRDSSVYLDAAKNLAHLHRYAVSVPGGTYLRLTHFPPLYPALLSLGIISGAGPFSTARVLCSILYAVNLLLGMLLVYRSTENNRTCAALYGVFWGAHSITLSVHTMAWSEPLALFFAQAAIFFWLHRPLGESRRQLALAMAILSLAILTRYAAVAYVISLTWVSFIEERPRTRQTFAGWAGAILLGLVPLMMWILHNKLGAGEMTDRRWLLHAGALIPAVGQLVSTLSSWIFPASWSDIGKYIAPLLVALAFSAGYGSQLKPLALSALHFCRLFAVSYLTVLIVTIAFLDADTPMDARLLFPLQALFCWSVVIRVYALWCEYKPMLSRGEKAMVAVCGLLYALSQGYGSWPTIRDLRQDGVEYASRRWQNSELLAQIRSLSSQPVFFSNVPQAISLYTTQSAFMMPEPHDAERMIQLIRSKQALLVLMEAPGWPLELVDARLVSRWGLKRIIRAPDGVLYGS